MSRWSWVGMLLVLTLGGVVPAGAQTTDPPPPTGTPAAAKPNAEPTLADLLRDGDKFMAQGQSSKALSPYLVAWLKAPDNVVIITRIGNVYFANQKYADASRFFALAIKLNPRYEDAIVNMAQLYLRAKMPDQAVMLLEDPAKVKLFARSANYQHVLGQAYMGTQKYDKAVSTLKTAISLNPDKGALYGDLGNALYVTKKYADAVEAYSKAIEKSPKDATAYLNRSMAQKQLGRFAAAAESLAQYLTLTQAAQDNPKWKEVEELKAKGNAK